MLHLFCQTCDFKSKKHKKKIEKMSDDEVEGLLLELGTPAAFLALSLSNKKQPPKNLKK